MDLNKHYEDTRWSWHEGKDTMDWSTQFEGSLHTHNDMDTSTLCNIVSKMKSPESKATYLRFHKLVKKISCCFMTISSNLPQHVMLLQDETSQSVHDP